MNISEKKYYIEPVEIEIYLKKAGIVRTIIKDLKIELIDVEPNSEKSREIFDPIFCSLLRNRAVSIP